MAVSTPEDFYTQLVSLFPDPEAGMRDSANIQAFFAVHPESKDFNDWRARYSPTNSFSSEQYHSINAFYLIDEQDLQHAVCWKAVPRVQSPGESESVSTHSDALHIDIIKKLQFKPVLFDLVITLTSKTDNKNDPAIVWPEHRKTINADTINVVSSQPQSEGAFDSIHFDPFIFT
ncbi:MAG: catalase [Oleispira sp.]|jgi:catalase